MLDPIILRRKTNTQVKDATAQLEAWLGLGSWDFYGWKGYFVV